MNKIAFRYCLYVLAAGAAVVFGMPLVWLLVTSLKPLDQAMSLPPTLIPRAYYATIGGQRVEVARDYPLPFPGVIATPRAGSPSTERLVLTMQEASERGTELLVEKTFAAGWWRVTSRATAETGSGAPQWDIVPPEAVESIIRFRWENYPMALATLGGQSVDEARGIAIPISNSPEANVPVWRFFANTLIVGVLGVIGAVLANAIIAYGFARIRWRGRDAFFALTLATMMVPFPVLMVPLYGLFRQLDWIGTLLPLWVPSWFGSAFNIFLLRQFFRTIPESLSEAARIDGCSEWTIFWRIILPLSKPVLATVALFHFLWAWNDFMGPLLYLTRRSTFTLAVALQTYQSEQGGALWHYLMAASTLTILPVVCLFFFAQKTFIQGIATTGSKN